MAHTRRTKRDPEDTLRKLLEQIRWPDGQVECPRCQSKKISRIRKRSQFDCDDCRYQFSTKVGTFLKGSHLPLKNWFDAVYLLCESPNGVSPSKLKSDLSVSHKTAQSLCACIQREREAASIDSSTSEAKFFEMFRNLAKTIHERRNAARRVDVIGIYASERRKQ